MVIGELFLFTLMHPTLMSSAKMNQREEKHIRDVITPGQSEMNLSNYAIFSYWPLPK